MKLEVGLHAAVCAVEKNVPLVLTVADDGLAGLPFGPFQPTQHRTLDNGLRSWVENQTRLKLGYVEQLYTFGDHGRLQSGADLEAEVNFISVGYLALVRPLAQDIGQWHDWYDYLPWEDWRTGQPVLLSNHILPALADWVDQDPHHVSGRAGMDRQARLRLAFGCDFKPQPNGPTQVVINNWDEERTLERYELMYEANLIDEAVNDGRTKSKACSFATGKAMLHDHRRILATAIARLRGKLKYRPVVFELLPESFTLTELQQTVETLSGRLLHKQNFRRMVDNAGLVKPTGATSSQTGGRPAAYFRFRRSITRERPAPGLKITPSG